MKNAIFAVLLVLQGMLYAAEPNPEPAETIKQKIGEQAYEALKAELKKELIQELKAELKADPKIVAQIQEPKPAEVAKPAEPKLEEKPVETAVTPSVVPEEKVATEKVREYHPEGRLEDGSTGPVPIYDIDETPPPAGVVYIVRNKDGSFRGGGSPLYSCGFGKCVKPTEVKTTEEPKVKVTIPAQFKLTEKTEAKPEVKAAEGPKVREYDGQYPIYEDNEEKPVGIEYETRWQADHHSATPPSGAVEFRDTSSHSTTKTVRSVVTYKVGGG